MPVLRLVPGRTPMFPPTAAIEPGPHGLVAIGGDLRPQTLLEAYRKGVFPWEGSPPIPWFSPDPRMILEPGAFRTTRSLEKRARNSGLVCTFDRAFGRVMRACATTPRQGGPGTWITEAMIGAYGQLHEGGIGHSVEVWRGDELVGGLYGLAMGRAFFGESMFHRERDASKLALRALCRRLEAAGYGFVDCQQETDHLRSLGARPIPRARYLDRLETCLRYPDAWPSEGAAPG